MKRVFSILTAASLLLSCSGCVIPLHASAERAFVSEIPDPEEHYINEGSTCATFDAKSNTLMLHGRIVSSQLRAFSGNKEIKYIRCEPGTIMPSHCDRMFANYEAESIDLSYADWSALTSMSGMFLNCKSLLRLNFGDIKTDKVTDMSSLFEGCEALDAADVFSFRTQNVRYMGYMFAGCTSLRYLNFFYFDTENVIDMSYMFSGCENLVNLDISSFRTPNVRSMKGMFSGCRGINTLDLCRFNTSAVCADGFAEMFRDCETLEFLDLSQFDTSGADSMFEMFKGCSGLYSLYVPFNTKNVDLMNSMFEGCSKLHELDLRTFETRNLMNASAMFKDDTDLCLILVSENWTTKNLTGSDEMFENAVNLCGVAGTVYDPKHTNGVYARIDTENKPGYLSDERAHYTTARFDEETGTLILHGEVDPDDVAAFQGNSSVERIICDVGTILPAFCSGLFSGIKAHEIDLCNANTTRVTDMSYMFVDCDELEYIDLMTFDTSHVTTMEYMFCNCSAITFIDLEMFDTSNVYDMSGMFLGCSSVEALLLSGWDTSNVESMQNMFGSCFALQKLDIAEFNTTNVRDMSGMFQHCTMLEFLDLYYFDTSRVENMTCMFYDCPLLYELDLTSFDTSSVTSMSGMFCGCTAMEHLDLSSFRTENVIWMDTMFAECCMIRELDLSSFDTRNVENTTEMFRDMTRLKTIYVSDKWNLYKVSKEASKEMFNNDTFLVGGNGTTFSTRRNDNEYARIDTRDTPGYLTGIKESMKPCRGDVNCDGGVDVSDAVLLARFAAEDQEAVIEDQGKKNADVDGAFGLTGDDVIFILQFIAKIKSQL